MNFLFRTKKLPKTVYFSFIIFNKAEDVKKAFEIDWFQSQINEKYKLSNLKAGEFIYIEYIKFFFLFVVVLKFLV